MFQENIDPRMEFLEKKKLLGFLWNFVKKKEYF